MGCSSALGWIIDVIIKDMIFILIKLKFYKLELLRKLVFNITLELSLLGGYVVEF